MNDKVKIHYLTPIGHNEEDLEFKETNMPWEPSEFETSSFLKIKETQEYIYYVSQELQLYRVEK